MAQKFIVESGSNLTAAAGLDLKVPTFVDWDGDGDFDLVVGHNKASIAPATPTTVNDTALLYFTNDGTGIFTEQTGTANPFNSLKIEDIGNTAFGNAFNGPAVEGAIVDFFDADGDGDLDLLVGGSYGNLYFYKNDPVANSAAQPFGTTATDSNTKAGNNNKLLGEIAGTTAYAAPRFVDIDGDDIPEHLFIGHYNAIDYYVNDSTTNDVNFVRKTGTDNPFSSITLTDSARSPRGNRVVPYFIDFSGDDVFDAFIGSESGKVRYFLNTGTNLTPVFTEQFGENNPFNELIIGTGGDKRVAPAFADVDGDEAIEAYVGTDGESDPIFAFENFTETGTNPTDFLFYDETSQRFIFGPSGISGSNLKIQIAGAPSSKVANLKVILKDKNGTAISNGNLDVFSLLAQSAIPNNFAAPGSVVIDDIKTALGSTDVTGINFEFGVQLRGSSSVILFDQITSSSTGIWQLKSSNSELSGLTITLNQTADVSGVGVGPVQRNGVEVIDLTAATAPLTATFSLYREAVYTNVFGLYRVDDPFSGAIGGLRPGDAGYARAAIENRIPGLDLTVGNNATSGASSRGLAVGAGAYYAPFILAAATIDEFLADNPNNEIQRKNQAYFAYSAANPDGQDHLILLGNNIFGFEDLSGGGDFDYNDLVVQVDFA